MLKKKKKSQQRVFKNSTSLFIHEKNSKILNNTFLLPNSARGLKNLAAKNFSYLTLIPG